MFSGIVAAVGTVVEVGDGRLVIGHGGLAAASELGASVAVNGACLTVVARDSEVFAADVVPETLRRTNLGRLEAGSRVNLELSTRAGDRLDGHLVLGHVDATALVTEVVAVALGREVELELPDSLARFVAEKGSVAVDGVSLTVARLAGRRFTVALVPHTLAHTIAGGYEPGSVVNLEVDVIARYAERLLANAEN